MDRSDHIIIDIVEAKIHEFVLQDESITKVKYINHYKGTESGEGIAKIDQSICKCKGEVCNCKESDLKRIKEENKKKVSIQMVKHPEEPERVEYHILHKKYFFAALEQSDLTESEKERLINIFKYSKNEK